MNGWEAFAAVGLSAVLVMAAGVGTAADLHLVTADGTPIRWQDDHLLIVHDDEVTIELAWKIGRETAAARGIDYPYDTASAAIAKMVEDLDRKGKRFGKGFYEYPEDGRKFLWPGLAEHFPAAETQPDVEELQTRLLVIQSLETARCVEEGVVTHAEDGDIGSIFGWGFPPYTGGTLSYIDTIGVRKFVAECDRMADAYGERFKVSDWLRERAESGQDFYG